MAVEEIRVIFEGETEPIYVLIEEGIGHGTQASITDHRDVNIVGTLQNHEVLQYDQSQQKFINKLIEGVLEYDDDYECFIVP